MAGTEALTCTNRYAHAMIGSIIARALTAFAALGILNAAPAAAAAPQAPADLVFVNGVIHTMDAHHPKATWIAVRDGRIEALGEARVPKALQGPATRIY